MGRADGLGGEWAPPTSAESLIGEATAAPLEPRPSFTPSKAPYKMPDPILLGPIVGEVTDTSARVVVQAASSATVEVRLSNAQTEHIGAHSLGRGEVRTFVFDQLAPQVEYAMTVCADGVEVEGRRGRVWTRSADPDSLHLIAVSCNFTVRQGRSRLWNRIWEKWVAPGTARTVLHLGDQVYADSAFADCLSDIQRNGRGRSVQRRCKGRFESLYQSAWNDPATREVLSHASNLMMWDDHEVRNSWGGFEEDRDKDSDAYFVASIARAVFQQYQRALWADVDPSVEHEGHAHTYGKLGLLFLDLRSARSFSFSHERPYLGTAQWEWIRRELRVGKLSQAQSLAIVSPVPICYVSSFSSGQFDGLVSDLRDHWTHPDHLTEFTEMLVEVRRWLAADPSRCVLFLGGDVHVGGETSIQCRTPDSHWEELCRQLITSPVTNRPHGTMAWWGIRNLLLRGVHSIGRTFRFDHEESSFTNRRNFAVLTMVSASRGEPRIHASLELDSDD